MNAREKMSELTDSGVCGEEFVAEEALCPEKTKEFLEEKEVVNWEDQADVTHVSRTVMLFLAAGDAAAGAVVGGDAHARVVETFRPWVTEGVEGYLGLDLDGGLTLDLLGSVEAEVDRFNLG